MESGRQPVVNTQVRANWNPESAGELLSAIGNNVVWFAAVADHVFEKHFHQLWGVDILPAGQVDCQSYQSIHNKQDSCIHGGCRLKEVRDEVYGHGFARPFQWCWWDVCQ